MPRLVKGLTALCVAGAALAIVYACQDDTLPTSPQLAAVKPAKRLTVTGSGSGGSGTVTGASGITCVITLGVAAPSGCTNTFAWKTNLTLTASPAAGDAFAGWSGACTGTGTCRISMMQDRNVAARFNRGSYQLTVSGQGSGTGSVTSSPGGISCQITGGTAAASGCQATYLSRTNVTLTPTPAAGHTFSGWSGACTGTGSCVVSMIQARSVTATFSAPQQVGLTVTGGGNGNGGVTSSPAGINCSISNGTAGVTGCGASFAQNTVVTLTAAPASGHTFAGWSGACSAAGSNLACQIALAQAASAGAAFTAPAQFPLTVAGGGTGSGTVTSQQGLTPAINCSITNGTAGASGCSANYASGTVVTLTAAPLANQSFTGWSGACTGTSPTCQVTLSQARSVTASFAPQFTLSVAGGGNGSGKVTSQQGLSPVIDCTITNGTSGGTGCSAGYPSGTSVTLTAAPAVGGHSFTGWSGSCSGTSPTCVVAMSQARSITASFAPPQFSLTVLGGGNGNGSATSTPAGISCQISGGLAGGTGCSAGYASGTSVTLTAGFVAGYSFTGWGGACSGTGLCHVTIDQAKTVVANFAGGGAANVRYTQGKWDPTFATPIVALHLHLLPNGKLLMWGKSDLNPYVLDLSSVTFTPVASNSWLFCAGHNFLADGRVLVSGGHITDDHGLPDANIFSSTTQSWTKVASMAFGRWYPTVTMLENGQLVSYAGRDQNNVNVPTPELWNGSAWVQLDGINKPLPYYPRSFLAPDGRVFYAGEAQPSGWLDPYANAGHGQWTSGPTRQGPCRDYGSAVMYAPGKILYVGGCSPPVSTAEIIDLNAGLPAWTPTGSLHFARRNLNTTILPNGTVLANGGNSDAGAGTSEASAVKVAELWNPATGAWTLMASEAALRSYHSTALLLPDGRVISTGAGDGALVPNQKTAQIFYPTYLFNQDGTAATRPTIGSVSTTQVRYGQNFTITSPEASYISKVTLIRLSSVTHAFNASQVTYPVSFSKTTETTLTATAPPNARRAPPGPYLLFILNGNGVPSSARIVSVGP
jgi:hypothetical protein